VEDKVRIGIVGKYFQTGDFVLTDSYISVLESIKHACWKINKKPDIVWINSELFEQQPEKITDLDAFDGIIVPGGFGKRGVEGKILAIKYCRENKIPYFGLCYGMQLAVIEFARHVCGIANATTGENEPDGAEKVIDLMPEQLKNMADSNYGGTMRLGAYPCIVKEGTKAFDAYKTMEISERHRHRYEVNNDYREQLEKAGLVFSGVSPDGHLVEMSELPDHPFFLGVQFHPEFKSRPITGHPLFNAFIEACAKEKKSAGYKERFKQ
jgi:CTP synthase